MEGSLLRKRLLRHLKLDLTSRKDLRARKEKRLQEIGARIKSQRLELEERKKQKEVKFTDRVPPMKRARGCECYCAARIITEKFKLVVFRVVCSSTKEFVSEDAQRSLEDTADHVRAMHATPNASCSDQSRANPECCSRVAFSVAIYLWYSSDCKTCGLSPISESATCIHIPCVRKEVVHPSCPEVVARKRFSALGVSSSAKAVFSQRQERTDVLAFHA